MENVALSFEIIIPFFNEEESISVLVEKLNDERDYCLKKFKNVEIHFCFINDGSSDDSLNILSKSLKKSQDLRFKILNLSRNFGHQNALAAGFVNSHTDYVIVMDADLQDPPYLIRQFIKKIIENPSLDIIHAVREERKEESLLKKLLAKIHYKIFDYLTTFNSTLNSGDCKLYSKRIIELFNKYSGKELYYRGMSDFLGFNHSEIKYTRDKREFGSTKYSLSKSFSLSKTAIFTFSQKPLSFFGIIYISFSLIILLIVITILIIKIVSDEKVEDLLLLVFIISTFNMIQSILFNLVSVYISKITRETSSLPNFIIQDKFQK